MTWKMSREIKAQEVAYKFFKQSCFMFGNFGIYAIGNTVQRKLYIGSSTSLCSRISSHATTLRSGKHSNRHIQEAFNQDGIDAFTVFVLHFQDPSIEGQIERLKNWCKVSEFMKREVALNWDERFIINSLPSQKTYNISTPHWGFDQFIEVGKTIEPYQKIVDQLHSFLNGGECHCLGSFPLSNHKSVHFMDGRRSVRDLDALKKTLLESSSLNALIDAELAGVLDGVAVERMLGLDKKSYQFRIDMYNPYLKETGRKIVELDPVGFDVVPI